MQHADFARGLRRVAATAAIAGLAVACSSVPRTPAPVIMMGDAPGISREAALYPAPLPAHRPTPAYRPTPIRRAPPEPAILAPPRALAPSTLAPSTVAPTTLAPATLAPPPEPGPSASARGAEREGRHIVVRPGQSVGGLAEAYHVPAHAIIAANHLRPPYNIEIGQRLVIPGADERPTATGIASLQRPASPTRPSRGRAERPGAVGPAIIPLDGPLPKGARRLVPPVRSEAASREPSAAEEARAEAAKEARETAARETRERAAEAAHAKRVREAREKAAREAREAARRKAREHHSAAHESAARGERFPWPVHGRILVGYGIAAGGHHNDGINIAAPRGAPVRAIDSGTVAYAGNQLRGYGNLILVKHPDGWISAYAHCENLLVKRGERVHRGQIIARVGETGGVTQPQLHFELRRGKRPVNPREYLAPVRSTAAGRESIRRG